MNSFENIINSIIAQNEMTDERLAHCHFGLQTAQKLFEKYRGTWVDQAKDVGWSEDFDYVPNVKVENIEAMSNEEWLESRKEGIGGSEAGTILGLNKYSNIQDLAIKKLAIKPLPEPDADQQYTLDYGHAMEPVILKLYEAKSGNMVFTDRHQYQHSKAEYMLADCDGLAITPEGEPILLELKSFNYNLKDAWTPGIYGKGAVVKNPEYIAQVRHYLSVLNLNRADIIAECGNMAADMTVITVYRDIQFEKELIDAEASFWHSIQEFYIPEMPYMPKHIYDSIRSVIVNEAPEADGPVIFDETLIPNFDELIGISEEKKKLSAQVKMLEEREYALRKPIIEALGKSPSGHVIKDGKKYSVTYKGVTKKTVDMDKLSLGYPEVYNEVQKTVISSPVFRLSERAVKKK